MLALIHKKIFYKILKYRVPVIIAIINSQIMLALVLPKIINKIKQILPYKTPHLWAKLI